MAPPRSRVFADSLTSSCSSTSSPMRIQLQLLLFSLLVAWQFVLTLAAPLAEAATATRGARIATWAVKGVRDTDEIVRRVAILTTSRDSAEAWCMGLLVAPDALLTYAHCVSDKNITWAFFGDSRESFFETQQKPQTLSPSATNPPTDDSIDRGSQALDDGYAGKRAGNGATASIGSNSSSSDRDSSLPSHRSNSNSSSFMRRRLDTEVEVGDVTDWVEVTYVTIHPAYDPSSRAASANDLAVVRLRTPRENVSPFQLLPNEPVIVNKTKVQVANLYFGYRVSNAFISRADTVKVNSIGSFYRTLWRYCTLAKVNGKTLARKMRWHEQMCIVASKLRERVALSTINSFVLVGDQLAGLSFCYSTDCQKSVVHPFALVSGAEDFIKSATQTQAAWTDMQLFTIGGDTAPLQGYLAGLRKTQEGANFCLGTLIAPQTVLTAAHCVKSEAFSYVSVGSLHSSSVVDGEQIAVKSVKIHPLFDATTLAYDFALVELQYISIQPPLTLDNEKDDELYRTAALTLYGYSETRAMQSLSLPLVSMSVCKALISDASVDMSTLVCAGGEEGRDGCQGDSGAPLVQESNGEDQYLVALSSFGWGCGIKGVPAVYAKVTAATSFIQKNVLGHTWRFKLSSNGQLGTPAGDDDDDNDNGDDDVDEGNGDDDSTGNGGVVKPSSAPSNRPTGRPPRPLSPSEDGRSGDFTNPDKLIPANAKSIDDFIARLCAQEKWTPTQRISVAAHLQTFVIPATASQLTRNTVATTLLSSAGAEVFEDDDARRLARSTYICTGSIEMFSSADLSSIESKLAKFEGRSLRKRASRFARAPGMERLPLA